ncbi:MULTISPECIES: hypothetical protein [unclassified Fibrobacter]|uniref:hypothetical protein n=1 Tax=unclassified Fibrobacter TaxID=2634177 RepID=UPI000D6A901D|nr:MULTISPECIES: hypothetical protein [unclassified Fibrobacter]PWJ56679.1 hypothetical protein BGX12_1621 [Fibrobacter sp. UWR4]PZW62336.1 hypothetical protein C8E88_10621 [Fibrobacter sp. UWR1]
MIFNHFVDKLSTETHEYAYLVKIYLLMKKYGQDIAMLTQTFLPIIQKKLRENEIEAKIVENHLPYGLKKQDVLDMQ